MKIGVAKERAPNERRVALVPDALKQLIAAGAEILVEQGAGDGATIPDRLYTDAGARVVSRDELYRDADVIARVQKPADADFESLREGQAVVGILQPLIDPQLMDRLAKKKVTAISLDAIPRTLSRAQSMDVLSSQANVGGYRAVLIGAQEYGRYFPLLTTAAGTAKPANVLILGIGVAGLQAIATARRLGAIVKAYDVRIGDEGAGRVARRAVPRAQVGRRRVRHGRLCPPADARGTGRAAGRAERLHQWHGRGHHDGPGARPTAATARNGQGRRGHEAGFRDRRHGRVRPGRQRRAVEARRDGRHATTA